MRLLVTMVVLCAVASAAVAGDMLVKVYVDGKLQKYDPPARVRNGTTYVPLRQGATSLGFEVKWMADINMAQVCSANACIMIPKTDGIIVDGRLFLPLRKMGEAFGAEVKWDGKKKSVYIKKGKAKKTFG